MIRTDEFLAMLDLVSVVGRHVELKKAGADFVGLCPFHAEKTASFRVSPRRQRFKCFGCGKHGDAIGFYRELLGLGFLDACAKLAEENGVKLDGVTSTVTEHGRQILKLAEVELPAFDLWMKMRIEALKRQADELRDSFQVRRAMAREIEKLASGDSGLSPEQIETFREVYFAQVDLALAMRDTGERIESEIERLEMSPEAEVPRFLRMFYVNSELREGLEGLL